MPIHVLNKKTYSPATHPVFIDPTRVIYVGRPTILGNPYYHEKALPAWSVNGYHIMTEKVPTRGDAVEKYRHWLHMHREMWHTIPDACETQVWREILRIAELIRKEPQEDWGLVCWCAPEACHADVIKRAIEWVMAGMPKKGE